MKIDSYKAEFTDDLQYYHPIEPGIIFINKEEGICYFACPCGCHLAQVLNFEKGIKPCWDLDYSDMEHPTIDPSVRNLSHCLSHYFIKKGKVIWC